MIWNDSTTKKGRAEPGVLFYSYGYLDGKVVSYWEDEYVAGNGRWILNCVLVADGRNLATFCTAHLVRKWSLFFLHHHLFSTLRKSWSFCMLVLPCFPALNQSAWLGLSFHPSSPSSCYWLTLCFSHLRRPCVNITIQSKKFQFGRCYNLPPSISRLLLGDVQFIIDPNK